MIVKDENNKDVEYDAVVCPQIAECFSDEYRLHGVRVNDEVAGSAAHATKDGITHSK